MEQDHRSKCRRQLGELLAPGRPVDIVEAALWVAAEEYPDLAVSREVARVHILGGEAARCVESLDNPFERLDRLRVFLYEDLGFRGNRHAFKDPRNSFLNEVLNRRLGIPITLSILFMELARAAGFEARGVALPGHFVVRLSYNGRTILVDPFHGATVISEEDCRQLVARSTGKPGLFLREQLEGTDERHMLGRMLRNLKQIYVEREDFKRALSVVERLLILRPGDMLQIRDSGYLKAHLGQPGGAISDLETYLSRSPQARDNASVRSRLVWLRRRISEMN